MASDPPIVKHTASLETHVPLNCADDMSRSLADGESARRRRISRTELRRRLWHISPGLLPILSWAIPHRDPMSLRFQLIAGGIIVFLAVALWRRYHTVVRTGEQNGLTGVVGYAASILLTLLLFPAHEQLGQTVLIVLAFGDGSATLGGLLVGGRALPWNREKSWAGTASFVGIGAPLASLTFWAIAQPKVPVMAAVICGTTATIVAAVAESLPLRINDNVRVGIAAAVSVAAAQAAVLGL